ncbi:MAG TPA: hypothetical protein VJX72_09460 [Candidatus Acidoferrum sp.]|jgi:hypothetical protein|nr:hypothetical protein [Candidatus Acidoferrum sp.]
MKVPQYDIFSGTLDRDALWLEAVEGLGAACERMKERAKESPGAYFVFCSTSRAVLASTNTSVPAENQDRESA